MLTSEFITSVRRQGAIPSTMTDATIMSMGDEEIQGRFIPLLESLRQNYFVREITSTPDARGRVPIPPRAVGAALRNVQLNVNNVWVSLPQRAMEEYDSVSTGQPAAYYLDAGSICLLPNGTSGTLRIRYPARPGKMVLSSDPVMKGITAVVVGPTTTAITCAYSGAANGIGLGIDIIAGGPAHQQKAIGITLTGASPNWVAQNSDLLDGLVAAFDVLGLADQNIYVPLPEELFSALVHSVAANILLAKGYLEESSAQEQKAARCVAEAKLFLMPRNEGNPQVVSGGLRRALQGGQSRRGRW